MGPRELCGLPRSQVNLDPGFLLPSYPLALPCRPPPTRKPRRPLGGRHTTPEPLGCPAPPAAPAETRPLPSAPAAAPVSMGTKAANRRGGFRSALTEARTLAAPGVPAGLRAAGRDAEGQDPLRGALRGEAWAGGAASGTRAGVGPRSREPSPTAPILVCAAGFTVNSVFPDLDPVVLRPEGPR